MTNNLSKENGLKQTPPNQICPECGTKLLQETLPSGQIELICPDLECNFTYVGSTEKLNNTPASTDFGDRLSSMNKEQLQDLAEKLDHSAQVLAGRPARLARRQLAIVQAELENRLSTTEEAPQVKSTLNLPSEINQQVPPQFATPKATAKRIRGIREYYRRVKADPSKSNLPHLSDSADLSSSNSILSRNGWLETFIKSLHDEALRHEQAAQNYARVPDLFPLHIEHAARAFEINRIVDLLHNYAQMAQLA